ncbi:Uncharacterised protein [Mycobacteroides abscessus subsp. abscessus]|nr:Uncharacterised protein [Mycobacteroides abscessus subsp. abscessus]
MVSGSSTSSGAVGRDTTFSVRLRSRAATRLWSSTGWCWASSASNSDGSLYPAWNNTMPWPSVSMTPRPFVDIRISVGSGAPGAWRPSTVMDCSGVETRKQIFSAALSRMTVGIEVASGFWVVKTTMTPALRPFWTSVLTSLRTSSAAPFSSLSIPLVSSHVWHSSRMQNTGLTPSRSRCSEVRFQKLLAPNVSYIASARAVRRASSFLNVSSGAEMSPLRSYADAMCRNGCKSNPLLPSKTWSSAFPVIPANRGNREAVLPLPGTPPTTSPDEPLHVIQHSSPLSVMPSRLLPRSASNVPLSGTVPEKGSMSFVCKTTEPPSPSEIRMLSASSPTAFSPDLSPSNFEFQSRALRPG